MNIIRGKREDPEAEPADDGTIEKAVAARPWNEIGGGSIHVGQRRYVNNDNPGPLYSFRTPLPKKGVEDPLPATSSGQWWDDYNTEKES